MKKLIVPSLLALTFAAGLSACAPSEKTGEAFAEPVTKTAEVKTEAKPELGSFGVDIAGMDTSVKPGDNFFKYVSGTWMKNTEIPADKSNYGAFTKLADRSEEQVKAIIQEMAKMDAKADSSEQKIGDLYAAFMDTDKIEKKGLDPVKTDLEAIASLDSHSAVSAMMGNPSMGLEAPVGGWVNIDSKDTSNYIFYITQSGLGMPNRSYYLDDDDKSVGLREDYMTFLKAMLSASGADNIDVRAQSVMDFETKMATAHWTPEKRRDRDLTYNKMTKAELVKYAQGFDWQAMMDEAGIGDQDVFVVRENDAIQGLTKTFGETNLNVLKDYMTIHYLSGKAAHLPKAIDEANFAFYGKALRGTEQQRDRWKRGVSQVSGTLGEAIGQVYVKRHFPPDSKRKMDELVENLRSAFKDGIDRLEWMGADTKVEAQDKLAKFVPKIGYPDVWTDYSSLKVDRNDLIGTVKSANQWEWNDMISDLGGPIDKSKWFMNPQTVNAYYNPALNEIVFPAAILQAPFFDPNADPAVNYGGIGAVIGHEMGHGFDDQGSKSDGNGEQRNWWSDADLAAFKERSDSLVGQFNEFEPLPGLNVNGKLTLGENIGDLTGLTMAYAAYKKSLNGKDAPVIDGLTGDQRFFLSYAQIWQRKFREEALRNRVKTDPHSPGEYRANGIVRNFDAWYDAFDIQPGDALYLPPEQRVKIW
ncbi:MAG: M13 family metallopeptidase [Hyphomonadaceae bacterium]|nr:M13 family metallopeptidase [Hyphomonadaceae bacterium]